MNALMIVAIVAVLTAGWMIILRNWRFGIYLLFCFTPITGLVVAALQPSTVGNLVRDILIIIPLYISFFLTKKPSDRVVVPMPLIVVGLMFGLIIMLEMVGQGTTNALVGLVGAKVWLLYIPLMAIGSAALASRADLEAMLRTIVVTAWIPLLVGLLMWGGAIAYDYQKSVELLYGDFARNATQGFVALRVGNTTFYRIPSTFQFVSQYAAFCQFIIFPIVMLIRSDRSRRWRVFGYVSLLLAVMAALTSGSRGAFLFLPFIFLTLAALRMGMGGSQNLAMAMILLVAVAIASLFFDSGAIFDHVVELAEINGQGIVVGGLSYAIETGGMFGIGVGGATIAARYVLDPNQSSLLFSTAIENYYAKAWLELGFFGFIAVVLLLGLVIIYSLTTLSRIRDIRLRDCGIAVAGMTIFVAFISSRGWPLDQDPFAYYYYLFVGFLFKLPSLAAEPALSGQRARRTPVGPIRPGVLPGARPNWR